MKSRVLPIGIQSFSKIRCKNYLYVDKTEFIYKLASEAGIYFLSRPRRFGKSLLISTLEAYLSGQKELFNGLKIKKLEEENPTGENGAWTPSPVIKMDFNAGNYDSADGLREKISELLFSYEKIWGKEKEIKSLEGRFISLIQTMYKKTGLRVAVLIDEYDKPLLQNISNKKLNNEMRDILKAFFGVLKSVDDYTRFVFITGVTKFSHVSIYSDLNQLRDISLLAEYNDICGMTMNEIESVFLPEIENLAKRNKLTVKEVKQKLTQKYDGYKFTGFIDEVNGIFNPFSILNCLTDLEFENYWFKTGTPSFLVEMMDKTNFDVRKLANGVERDASVFDSYRADQDDIVPLFYQSGYFTIKDYDSMFNIYTLAVPNVEVEYGLYESLYKYCLGKGRAEGKLEIRAFIKALMKADIDTFINILKSLIATIPYDDTRKSDKAYTYKVAVFLIFTLAGQYIRSEVHTIKGRMDAVCETVDSVYIFEFKMADAPDGTADDAIKQIEDNGYDNPFKASNKQIYKLGVVFDSKERNIVEWKVK